MLFKKNITHTTHIWWDLNLIWRSLQWLRCASRTICCGYIHSLVVKYSSVYWDKFSFIVGHKRLFHPFEDMKVQFCRIFELDISPLSWNRIKCKVYSVSCLWICYPFWWGLRSLCPKFVSNLDSVSSWFDFALIVKDSKLWLNAPWALGLVLDLGD